MRCDYLTGAHRDARLHEVTLALGAELLVAAKAAKTVEAGRKALQRALDSGAAAEKFQRMVAALGGPKDFIEKPEKRLRAAKIVRPVFAAKAGAVAAIDTRALGLAVIALGGGRRVATDTIDHAVGLTALAGKGAKIDGTTPLAMIHASDDARAAEVETIVRAAYRIGKAPKVAPAVRERIG